MTLVSVWQDRTSSRPPSRSGVSGDWEVVVVGAGLTGLTTALLLARAGRSVLVVEAEALASGTTARSTAKVSLLQGTQLSKVSARHSQDVVQKYVVANSEGQAWLKRFCDDHGVATQRRPAYTFGLTSAGARSARRECDVARRAGLDVTWLDRPDLPFENHGAVMLGDQLQVDPVELLLALAREAEAHGVTIVEHARVRQVLGHDPVRVTTGAGDATAETVVLATNMPFLDRGGFFARASPQRSYGLAFRTPEPAVDGMWLSADGPARSLRDAPSSDGPLLLVGGNGHVTGRGGSAAARLDDLREWTASYFPTAEETHAWSAQDYSPQNALPYVGPLLPGREEILVAGGYSKWGMTNGVAAALALSGRVLGGHLSWAEILHPWTSPALRGLLTGVKINSEVGLELTRGWIRLALPGGRDPDVSAVCTHLGGVVRWNDAERSWDCPLHGSRFGPDGQVLDGPATCGLKRR